MELGTSIRVSGCDFAYACHVKWYPVAFAYMCVGCLVSYPAVVAVQVQTFGEYLFVGLGIDRKCEERKLSFFWAKKLIEMALIWLLMFLNFYSLRKLVARFNIIASGVKITATATIILIGLFFFLFKEHPPHFTQPFANSTFSLKNGVFALFAALFTYDGWDILNFGTEEIEAPRK